MVKKFNTFIVIPAFNEEKNIGEVLKEVSKTKYPIVIVNDGSTDRTSEVLSRITNHPPASHTRKRFGRGQSRITRLTHRVNLGKGAAMKTGAEAAFALGADGVVFMDSDGQHKASDLPKFIKVLKKYDVVFGSRNLNHGVPIVRYLGNKFASVLIAFLFGIYISDLVCGYRAMTRKAYKKINWESSGYAVETEMVIKVGKYGLKHCEVPVETLYLDNVKGVTLLDSINILFDVMRWRLIK